MAKTRSGNEDTVPDAYPYFWKAKESSLNIDEFVKKVVDCIHLNEFAS
jgi:hypothetical protein